MKYDVYGGCGGSWYLVDTNSNVIAQFAPDKEYLARDCADYMSAKESRAYQDLADIPVMVGRLGLTA